MLWNMVPAIKRISTLWSEAKHLHLRARQSGGIAGSGYQRNPDTQMPEEHDHHVRIAECVAGFAAPALVDVVTRFAGP